MAPAGRPLARVMSFQLSPPSPDFQMPLRAPPEMSSQGRRTACQKPAYRMRGFVGSSSKAIAPVLSLGSRILPHVLPPSLDRNTPRVALGPNAWPSTATYTSSGVAGCTAMWAIWPASASPTFAQVFPASVERYMPSPGDRLPRIGDSPVPTYTTLGSAGATAIAPSRPPGRRASPAAPPAA